MPVVKHVFAMYGLILVGGFLVFAVDQNWPSTRRVMVAYPAHWEQGEYRNCHMIASDTLDCAYDEDTARMLVMDVKFIGSMKFTPYQPWTCQHDEDSLTCKKNIWN